MYILGYYNQWKCSVFYSMRYVMIIFSFVKREHEMKKTYCISMLNFCYK